MSEKLKHKLRDKIAKLIGFDIKERDMDSLITRFGILALQRGYQNLHEAIESLESDPELLMDTVELVSVSESYFFREPAQFEALAQILPELYARLHHPVRIWSMGTARGEELCTIAIIAHESGIPVYLLGTDVSKSMVETAKRGVFSSWSLRIVSNEIKEKYFVSEGGFFRLKDEIRRMCRFKRHNILRDPLPISGEPDRWDIIFCRNLLIYFTPEAIEVVKDRLYQSLSDDGLLFVASSEVLLTANARRFESFEKNGVFILRKMEKSRPHRLRSLNSLSF